MKTTIQNKTLDAEVVRKLAQKMEYMVRKAIAIIQANAHNVTRVWKLGYDQVIGDTPDDFATQGDFQAQDMYRSEILGDPLCAGFGILGEEGLNIPCTHIDLDIYFTIDPLDGTKAYWRKQSHGVGTMIALVVNDIVLAVCIGDANTGEIYTFAHNPEDIGQFIVPPTRIRFDVRDVLVPQVDITLQDKYLHSRESLHKINPIITNMVCGFGTVPVLFKDLAIDGGSIGICIAKLWKGEVGAIAMQTSTHETPWDRTPVIGMNNAMGYVTLRTDGNGQFVEFIQEPQKHVIENKPDGGQGSVDLIIHKDLVPQLNNWLTNCNLPPVKLVA